MRQGLSAMLDPRGVRILKRKLLAGEITPRVFKEVLKRQMVKQALQRRSFSRPERWADLIAAARGRFQPDAMESTAPFKPGPLDMEELFSLSRIRRM